MERAASITGSGDPFRELGRFHEFCMRMTFARTVPHPTDPTQTVGPCVADDPTFPVERWFVGRKRTNDIARAIELYLMWSAEASIAWRHRVMDGTP